MSNGPVNGVSKGNGLGGVLTTLASSGDNWVKLFIIGGIILNGYWSKEGKNVAKSNHVELDQLRQTVALQVDAIFSNQKTYIKLWDEERADHVRLLNALGVATPERAPIPQIELPSSYGPYPYKYP